MAKFKTPGVYIEEAPAASLTIIGTQSGTPIFISYTQKAIFNDCSVLNKPFLINTYKDYQTSFGALYAETSKGRLPGLSPSFELKQRVLSKVNLFSIPVFKMDAAVELYFLNGGGPCYIFSCGETGLKNQPVKAVFIDALNMLDAHFEGDILLMPDTLSLAANEYHELVNLALAKATVGRNRFIITDVHEPGLDTGKTLSDAVTAFRSAVNPQNGAYGAVYYPWLKTSIANNAGTGFLVLPPSPAIAAVYSRTDTDRGIWKAPANVSLNGISATVFSINNNEQDNLNVDERAGLSVNVIRPFEGKGILVWGARTLAGNNNEWRYVSVKRLFMWVEKSIQEGLQWAIFEPNDQQTWTKAKVVVENFLNKLWREGAFAGAKPEQAFYVKVGLNETMTQMDIFNGKMMLEIGMAPTIPAEFIFIRIALNMQNAG